MPYADPEVRREYRRKWATGWRARCPEKHLSSVKNWQANNREKVKGYQKTAARRRIENGKRREYEHGCTPEQFEAMWNTQEGRCVICGVPMTRGGRGKHSVVVDHDHATNLIRGLPCNVCNRGLGMFADDPATLDRAAAYLRRTSCDKS